MGYKSDSERFETLRSNQRLPQVILFEGIASIGKRRFVKHLAKLIACEYQTACGQCFRCQDIAADRDTELLFLDEKAYKVEHAKLVREHLSLHGGRQAGGGSAYRIVVVCNFDRANQQTQNQLLKTLEEPPPQSLIFMTTSRPQQLLTTILSRVVRWRLQAPTAEQIYEVIKDTDDFADVDLARLEKMLTINLYQTGRVLSELTQGDDSDRDEIQKILVKLLQTKSVSEGLRLSGILVKEHKVNIDDLTRIIAILLNEYYRLHTGLAENCQFIREGSPEIPWSRLQAWRRTLVRYRSLGVKEKIPLNLQMVLESFFAKEGKSTYAW